MLQIDEIDAALPPVADYRGHISFVEHNNVETDFHLLAADTVKMNALEDNVAHATRHEIPIRGQSHALLDRVDEDGTGADGEALGKSIVAVRVEATEGAHVGDGPTCAWVYCGDCHSSHLLEGVVAVLLDDSMPVYWIACGDAFLKCRGVKVVISKRCCRTQKEEERGE